MLEPDDPVAKTAWYEQMSHSLDRAITIPDKDDRIRVLGDFVLKLGDGKSIAQDGRWHDTFEKSRNALMAIPGHAKYFSNEIRKMQGEVKGLPTSTGMRVTYDRRRVLWFSILEYLPSPESVAVLGDFLSDDIDTPREVRAPNSDWGDNHRANSYGAFASFMRMGLRNAPVAPDEGYKNPETGLAKTRVWWGDVKAGNRTFSFAGQNVEYRFKADGTWETIPISNPPNDGPDRPGSVSGERSDKRQPVAIPEQPEPPWNGNAWIWISGAAAAFVGLLTWIFLSRRKV